MDVRRRLDKRESRPTPACNTTIPQVKIVSHEQRASFKNVRSAISLTRSNFDGFRRTAGPVETVGSQYSDFA
ncbi:uncharacterized protein ARMOST_02260 [Armillaria ostoyae]|uniref:Uncharacterized protein n=1 Tax=Armillaria ostoyae TaxID=47428 RepID=A0A284QR74_ARMOS|nr:uncharacterized protein ARMOST_02260 [Armillaria ostoyae]